MVYLFGARRLVLRTQARVAGGQRLRGIERLCADLTHVVDPHQPGGLLALGLGQLRWGFGQRGAGGAGMRCGEQGAQGVVKGVDQGVDGGGGAWGGVHGAIVHGLATLALNAGTSVDVINAYYASTVTGEQNIALLQSRRSRKTASG